MRGKLRCKTGIPISSNNTTSADRGQHTTRVVGLLDRQLSNQVTHTASATLRIPLWPVGSRAPHGGISIQARIRVEVWIILSNVRKLQFYTVSASPHQRYLPRHTSICSGCEYVRLGNVRMGRVDTQCSQRNEFDPSLQTKQPQYCAQARRPIADGHTSIL